MLQGLKAHRNLALGVAIALSGGALPAGSAYAADVTITDDHTGDVIASQTTNKTSGNEVVVGTENSSGYTPEVKGVVAGTEIENEASAVDVTNNKVTIHNVDIPLDAENELESVIGGYTSGSGSAKDNTVVINGGRLRAEVSGGETNKGKAEGNQVVIDGARTDVRGAVTGGEGSSAANNTVTIKDGKVVAENAGNGYYGSVRGGSASSGDATGNSVTISGGTVGEDLAAAFGQFVAGGIVVDRTDSHPSKPAAGSATDNHVTISGGRVFSHVYGGKVTDKGNAAKNTVTISGGTVGTNRMAGTSIVGGMVSGALINYGIEEYEPSEGDATENKVTVTGGTLIPRVYGGWVTDKGSATKNEVRVSDATHDADEIYGGKAKSGSASENTVTVRNLIGAQTTLFGGASQEGRADGNKIAVSGDTTRLMDIIAGQGKTDAKDNSVVMSGGQIEGGVSAGEAARGDVTNNSIVMSGGSVANLTAGVVTSEDDATAAVGNATGNTVTVSGGTVREIAAAGVVGADEHGDFAQGNATGNTFNIYGGTFLGDVYGGYFDHAKGKTTGNTVNIGEDGKGTAAGTRVAGTIYGGSEADDVTGNTLNVKGSITAANIANFDKVNFVLGRAGTTMLTLTDGAGTKINWSKEYLTFDTSKASGSATGESAWTLVDSANAVTYENYNGERTVTDTVEYKIDKTADGKQLIARGNRHSGNPDAAVDHGTYDEARGGISETGHEVKSNKLTVTGTSVITNVYGGVSYADAAKTRVAGAANENTAVLSGAATVANLAGGYALTAEKNSVTVESGTVTGSIVGGHAAANTAKGNTVELSGGTLGTISTPIAVTGGRADGADGDASGNEVGVTNTAVYGNIVGGSAAKTTNDNTIMLDRAVVHGTITGGTAANGTGNTLEVYGASTINKFENLQSLQFIVPETMTAAEAAANPLLRVNNTAQDITGMKLGVQVTGSNSPLKEGDEVSLLKVNTGGTITSDAALKNEVTGKRGVARRYDFDLVKTSAGDEIRGKITKISVSAASKSPVETRAAESALVASGGDLLADAGMASAVRSAASAGGSFDTWASQSGSSLRLKSGSHVDSKGYGLNVGFARANKLASGGTLTFGPFVEYGRGSYDSYLDDGTHGDGKMRYVGGGIMAKFMQKSGGYVEGSIRAGKAHSDYSGNVDGNRTNYESDNTYYGAHLGLGHAFTLKKGDTIDSYVKYFYTHQGATDETVYTNGVGEKAHFDAVNSQRLRIGMRFTHDAGMSGSVYAGLAYEYEFGGEAGATFGEDTAPSPSLKGSSYMLELGYRFAPKSSRVSYGLNLSGWQGKRRGITGGLQIAWGF